MLTIEAVVLWVIGFVTGQIASGWYLGDYFDYGADKILWNTTMPAVIFQMLGMFAALGLIIAARRRATDRTLLRYTVVFGLVLIGLSTMFLFSGRVLKGLPFGTYDGAVQTEDAASMLLDGHDPYATSFRHTPFAGYHMPHFGDLTNPVLDHYPYPPLNILLAMPSVIGAQVTGWPVEGRWVFLVVFIFISVALIMLGRNSRERFWLTTATLANPLLFLYPLIGCNDVLFASALVATALLANRRRWSWAGVAFGAALALKQTAWLAIPLWLVWLWAYGRQHRSERPALRRSILWAAVVTITSYVPFILWHPAALYDDLIRFVSGVVPHTYPIAGSTVWQLLVIMQKIPDAWTTMSAAIPELLVLAIVLPLAAWWVQRHHQAHEWLGASTVVIMCVSLVNRFFLDNYVSALLLMGIASLSIAHVQAPRGGVAGQERKE